MSQNKKAYFQGGGGVNEPTPGKKKYKSDPAILAQPRFKEPFYRNYDLYTIPGMEEIGPDTGWHGLQNYKSVQEFLAARRERLKPRYVADDSWILDSGKKTKENPGIKARAAILERIIKQAGPNYDLGKGLYQEMSDGKIDSIKDFREEGGHGPSVLFVDDNEDHMMPPKEHGTSIYDWKNSPYQGKPKAPKRDSNHLDFQYDEINSAPIIGDSESYNTPIQLGPTGSPYDIAISPDQINLGDFESYPYSDQLGGLNDKYLGHPDVEDKPESDLDWGLDLTEESGPHGGIEYEGEQRGPHETILDILEKKYIKPPHLNPAPDPGLYGLPDGVDLPDEDVGDPTDINPDYGTYGPESTIYEDKWNI